MTIKKNKITVEEERELLQTVKSSKGLKKKKTIRQIINNNLNLVKYMITRYFSFAKIDYEEAYAEGVKALAKAVEKFDPNIKNNRFAVYAGCWITQYIRSYIEKTKLIKKTLTSEKEVIYYDDSIYHQNDEKSSSLLDNISSESFETDQENIRLNDIGKCINSLINSLEKKDLIIFTRLYYKIYPINCLDIYCMVDEEEKKVLIEELKINKKKINTDDKVRDFLTSIDWREKEKNSSIISKYTKFFSDNKKGYKMGQIAKIINKSENYLRKLRLLSMEKLQELAKEKNMSLL